MAHKKLANEMMNFGSNIYAEKIGYDDLKQKFKQESKNLKSKDIKKKYPRRNLDNRAPLKLVEILNQKLAYQD